MPAWRHISFGLGLPVWGQGVPMLIAPLPSFSPWVPAGALLKVCDAGAWGAHRFLAWEAMNRLHQCPCHPSCQLPAGLLVTRTHTQLLPK